MTVERPEISYVESFEEVLLLGDERFEAVVEAEQGTTSFVGDEMQFLERLECLVTQVVIKFGCREVGEIRIESSYVGIDRHVVVIEHDEEIVRSIRCVVQSLECQATAYRGVAYDGHYIALGIVVLHPRGHSHAQSC